MGIHWLQLLFVLLAGGAFFGAWRAWSVRSPTTGSARRSAYLSDQTAARAYGAVRRLLDRHDFDLLRASSSSTLIHRLRFDRHRALALYLRQIRREFAAQSRWARECAARNNAPELAFRAMRQALVFYPLYALIRMQAAVGWIVPVSVDPTPLLRRIRPLREMQVNRQST